LATCSFLEAETKADSDSVTGRYRERGEGDEGRGGGEGTPPLDYISYDFLMNMKRSHGKGTQVFDALMQIGDAVMPLVGDFSLFPFLSRC
jgi:hypothetical protein